MIIEATAFKKLAKDGCSNFIPVVDDYVHLKREVLRIHREKVMLAVRKYNMIYESITEFNIEEELFSQHLRALEHKKSKGTDTLTWGPTIESFVAGFNDLCDEIYSKLVEFKQNEKEIHKKCQEISKLRFIVFDPKEPYKLSEFKDKQRENRKQIKEHLKDIFTEIRTILRKTYRHFIDQQDNIYLKWFSFVRKVDAKIESELRKAVKSSFQTFLKAITGDEKNKTNPIQLFKIFIMVEGKKDESDLIF